MITITFLCFKTGKSSILLFCSLVTFFLFLEINLSTFNSRNQINLYYSPIIGIISPFLIDYKILFILTSFIILIIGILNSKKRYIAISAHAYVLFSLYLFLVLICNINKNINYIQLLLLISIITASDVGGYLVGNTLGKTKIFPNISPNKTLEGSLGSIILCILVWFIFFKGFMNNFTTEFLSVVFISTCAQLGDLLVSFVKRKLKIKDSSKLIPGHGGVFDRMDSVIGGIFGYSLILYLF